MYDLNVANSKCIILCRMIEFRQSFESSSNKEFRRTKYLNAPFSSRQPSQIFFWEKKMADFSQNTYKTSFIHRRKFTPEFKTMDFPTYHLRKTVLDLCPWNLRSQSMIMGKYTGRSTSWVSLWIQSCKLFYNELISNKRWSNNLRKCEFCFGPVHTLANQSNVYRSYQVKGTWTIVVMGGLFVPLFFSLHTLAEQRRSFIYEI